MSITKQHRESGDSLRQLRADLADLAYSLMDDDQGISEDSYMLLRQVFDRVGGMPALPVNATDGRMYLSNRSF